MRLLTAATSALAALMMTASGNVVVVAAIGTPPLALACAVALVRPTAQLLAELFIITELVLLGSAWPSLFTFVGIAELPALVLGVWGLVGTRRPHRGEVYISFCACISALCLLFESYHLLTLPSLSP